MHIHTKMCIYLRLPNHGNLRFFVRQRACSATEDTQCRSSRGLKAWNTSTVIPLIWYSDPDHGELWMSRDDQSQGQVQDDRRDQGQQSFPFPFFPFFPSFSLFPFFVFQLCLLVAFRRQTAALLHQLPGYRGTHSTLHTYITILRGRESSDGTRFSPSML